MLKVLLVANYIPDQQESMLRFCNMLEAGLKDRGFIVEVIRPKNILGGLRQPGNGFRKWLGYVDKFILFIPTLVQQATKADLVHVCDHSNAPYLDFLNGIPHLITCHDLLAVRAALGEDTCCPVSRFGKYLQKRILLSLKRAQLIVCDSAATMADAQRLTGRTDNTRKVWVGLNYPYAVLPANVIETRLSSLPNFDTSLPYVLHVGSSMPRKNRDGILRIVARLRDSWPGHIVFAGEPLTPDLQNSARQLGIARRVIEVHKPDNLVLEALYNKAHALIFPSYSEGFGWPVVEAQSCGCPVICSSCGPLPEIASDSAMMHPPEDEEAFAEGILALEKADERQLWVTKGLVNARRFAADKMLAQYSELYLELSSSAGRRT